MTELSNSPNLNLPIASSIERIPLRIKFIKEFDIFMIKGPSTKPNLNLIYSVIMDEIKDHLVETKRLTVVLKLTRINFDTNAFMMELIELFNQSVSNGCSVNIQWYASTSNMELLKCGLRFQTISNFKFSVNTRMDKDEESDSEPVLLTKQA